MNWLKRIADLPQMPGVGSPGRFPEIWQQLIADQIDAAQAAKLLINEKSTCCQALEPMTVQNPNEPHIRGLYNELRCWEGGQSKQMQQQQQQQAMNPNNYPAGTSFMDQNGQPINNNVSNEGAQ